LRNNYLIIFKLCMSEPMSLKKAARLMGRTLVILVSRVSSRSDILNLFLVKGNPFITFRSRECIQAIAKKVFLSH